MAQNQLNDTQERVISTLRAELNFLQQKYDALNARFNINQITGESSIEMKRKLVNQAVGMGKVFVVSDGNEQQSNLG